VLDTVIVEGCGILQEAMGIVPLWLAHTTSGYRYGLVGVPDVLLWLGLTLLLLLLKTGVR
jgi:hypothetical protein